VPGLARLVYDNASDGAPFAWYAQYTVLPLTVHQSVGDHAAAARRSNVALNGRWKMGENAMIVASANVS